MSTSREQKILLRDQIRAYCKETHFKELETFQREFDLLDAFEKVVLSYPEVRSLWEKEEDGLLAQVLASNKLHIVPRVAATHSYLLCTIDTYHQFFKLFAGEQGRGGIPAFIAPIRSVMFSAVCIFMAEMVYSSCLVDERVRPDIKEMLAHDLVSLWDNAIDPRNIRFFDHLEELWIARDNNPPVFGTLDGNYEALSLLIAMPDDSDWRRFIGEDDAAGGKREALLEFAFGQSYEDIMKEKDRLVRLGKAAVDESNFWQVFGAMKPAYTSIRNEDPRTFYDFFVDRHNQALFRRRIAAEGPDRTIEEMYLEYLASQSLKAARVCQT